jgi:1-deoxy-D-xylulose-5-phosphate reductoisomerase
MRKGISILGSTGSIGTSTLRVVDSFPDAFAVVGLAAGRSIDLLAEQIARYRPKAVSVSTPDAREALSRLVDLSSIEVGVGTEGMVAVSTQADAAIVVAAAVGAVGLVPTYRALQAGKDVALANKETLVMAGELMMAAAKASGSRVLPIDSEHCALHQCLDGRPTADVTRLLLTASGGPFRTRPVETMKDVTPAEALKHPTWKMGRKITIDSATLMNKGLEVIEARWLFGLGPDRIDVILHPQSVIHSMVEFVDGTVLAQLSVTDMRVPIQYALSYPERWESAVPRMDFTRATTLDFEPPDRRRFPCLDLAYRALRAGGTLPAVLNATNEEAVAAFLDGRLPFLGIHDTVASAMDAHDSAPNPSLDAVLAADAWARKHSAASMAAAHR